MDAELLEMIEEEIQSYCDKSKIMDILSLWETLGDLHGQSNRKSFLVGSLCGSCFFLFRSFTNENTSEEKEKEFREVIKRRIVGLDHLLNNYLEDV
jgi:hypothetical protein